MRGHEIAPFGRLARVVARLAATLACAALVSGCFQPLYATRPATGDASVRQGLSAIEVQQIDAPPNSSEAYLAVQIRNNLLFDFTGGGPPAPPRHRLIIRISGSRNALSVDRASALPNIEQYVLNVTYTLTDTATSKVVLTGRTTANVSYETVGTQRYARISGMHDAERRAAKVVSNEITTRMASYLVAGS
jgi:LPS-assembly lipoprotein